MRVGIGMKDGKIGVRYGRGVSDELREYPDGLIDPYAECVWLEKMNGELKGVLVNYACHGTSYNEYSNICWDYRWAEWKITLTGVIQKKETVRLWWKQSLG